MYRYHRGVELVDVCVSVAVSDVRIMGVSLLVCSGCCLCMKKLLRDQDIDSPEPVFKIFSDLSIPNRLQVVLVFTAYRGQIIL